MRQSIDILRHSLFLNCLIALNWDMEKMIAKSLLINLIGFAKERGVELSGVLSRLKFNFSDEVQMVLFETYAEVFDHVMKGTGDENLGLHLGQSYNFAALGIVGQIIQVSRTLEGGVTKAIEFFNLFSNVLSVNLHKQSNYFSLDFELDRECLNRYPEACKHLVISSITFSFREIHYLTLKQTFPQEVSLDFDIHNKEEFTSVFKQPVKFKAGANKISFNNRILSEKIQFSDYELLMVLEAVARQRIDQAKGDQNSFIQNLKSLIYKLLEPEFPSLSLIARNLNMSERSLQRKLRAEGTSFSRVVSEIRKEIALDYLKKDLSIKEISYLLGYSEASVFINAFKKWYHDSPANYRLTLR
ncbi:MAG: AraC family transcriptional regulator [Bacteroidetes bacterium]|nr:MAG: AraC family transcriptional regulator [Bacteroidota bacterium]